MGAKRSACTSFALVDVPVSIPVTFHSREALAHFLGRHGLAAEKKLGQHFLADPAIVARMVAALDGIRSVLEVGPGPGILTGPMCDAVTNVAFIEIDERMRAPLSQTAPTARAHFGDALQTDLAPILDDLEAPRAIVSNLPYYITAPLLERFTAQRAKVDRMVLMMQKEVGDRIAAPAAKGERGSLSVSLQRLFTIERLVDVPPEAFAPPPKVRSVVLVLTPRDVQADPSFEKLVRAAFTHPRKTLANNLGAVYPREQVVGVAERVGLEPTIRPHQLDEEQWLKLQSALKD